MPLKSFGAVLGGEAGASAEAQAIEFFLHSCYAVTQSYCDLNTITLIIVIIIIVQVFFFSDFIGGVTDLQCDCRFSHMHVNSLCTRLCPELCPPSQKLSFLV